MPPYSDCGEMVAEMTYVYGVAGVNASLIEGTMASIKLSTESLSTPLPPSLSLTGRTYNRLQVSVTPPCDSGGDTSLSYQYVVKTAGNVVDSANFDCCSFIVEDLEQDVSYVVLVKVENSLSSSSPWVEAIYKTTSGIPPIPVATLLQVNTYSAVVALGSTPYDKETSSYDIHLHQNDIEVQQHTVVCQEDVDDNQFLCPASYKLETLEHETEYEVTVSATGPLGSRVSDSVRFSTVGIKAGKFIRDVYSLIWIS